MLEKGSDVNVVDNDGKNSLHCAAYSRYDVEEKVDLLLNYGLHINAGCNDGQTPLHIVCKHGSFENLENMLEKGSDVNLLDNNGRNSLHHAAFSPNANDKIDLLLNYGLNINARCNDGQTPLHIVCKCGSLETVEKILKRGSDVNVLDNDGRNPLHYAVLSRLHAKEKIDLLLKYDININARDKNGQTPLHIVCKYGSFKNVEKMLGKGSDENVVDNEGRNLLHHAASSWNAKEKIDLILNYGLNVNSVDKKGQTPLHMACKSGFVTNVKYLLERGADPSVTTVLKRNLLHYAAASKDVKTVEYILSRGFNVNTGDLHNTTPLHIACKYGDYGTVQLLELNGSDFNVVDDEKRNILHYAVECEELHSDLLEYLMDHVDVRAQDSNGRNALDYAIEKECNNAIKFLIETNSFSDYFNTKRETFLYWSIFSGCLFGVELFTDEDLDGINVNHENFPLFFATTDGHLQKKVLLKMTLFIDSLLKYTYASHKEIVAYMKHLSSKNDPIYSRVMESSSKKKVKFANLSTSKKRKGQRTQNLDVRYLRLETQHQRSSKRFQMTTNKNKSKPVSRTTKRTCSCSISGVKTKTENKKLTNVSQIGCQCMTKRLSSVHDVITKLTELSLRGKSGLLAQSIMNKNSEKL